MSKFRVKLRCGACGHKYMRTLKAEDRDELDQVENPPCPKCAAAERTIGFDPAGKPPAIGKSLLTKAIDETNEIVTHDHKMTDIRDRPHEGESSMPALPPPLQRQVDGFWGGKSRRNIAGLNPAALGRAALAGAYAPGRFRAPDVVKTHHDQKPSIPINIIASDQK